VLSKNSQGPYPLEHYDRTMRWHDKLNRRFTHRALDIPDDEMNNIGNKSGMGWKELAVIGVILLGTLWFVTNRQTAVSWLRKPAVPFPPASIQKPPVEDKQPADQDTHFQLRFKTE